MRLLHTADWHLGVTSGPAHRGTDHDRFFDWLVEQVDELEIDALLIAGDVFHNQQPSADATQRWFDVLARLARTGLAQIVVVGGNHDSAARLAAPAQVLRALDVHVVGGLTTEDVAAGRPIVPLRRRSGELGAVALAVPFVHEFRLGVRTTDLDGAAVRQDFIERFAAVYRDLADEAERRHPGVPLVGMGHLTVGSRVRRDDFGQEIHGAAVREVGHEVGTIEALPVSLFDARLRYVALGHLHRAHPVDDTRHIWYSGTPIPTQLSEGRTTRKVLLVELDAEARDEASDGASQAQTSTPAATSTPTSTSTPAPTSTPVVRPLDIPSSRGLLELKAPLDELRETIRTLTWAEPLPPLLHLRVVADVLPSDLAAQLQQAIEEHPEGARPVIVEVQQRLATERDPNAPTDDADPLQGRTLSELEPREVFERLLTSRGYAAADSDGGADGGAREALTQAFGQLASLDGDDDEVLADFAEALLRGDA